MEFFYRFASSQVLHRQSPCVFCASNKAAKVGAINYIGLFDFDMVQCTQCGLVSVDPIPSEAVVAKGCSRLYALQQREQSREAILRGFAKSFRRGARFARKYLVGKLPRSPKILEVGAGDGYFSAGIQEVIPESEVWLIDIVEDLVRFYQGHHACRAVVGEFKAGLFEKESFDLVVFRDLLEHVRDPFAFLREVHAVLKPGGFAFFITPNGKEDFWMINQRFQKRGEAELLLLNHFHYFLPETLRGMLEKTGFEMETAFKFGLKHYRKGLGHQEFEDFEKQSMPQEVPSTKSVDELWKHEPKQIRDRWLSRGFISRLYSEFVDKEKEKTAFENPAGHEFFVLAKKTGSKNA